MQPHWLPWSPQCRDEGSSASLALTGTHLLPGWNRYFHGASSELGEEHPPADGVTVPTCRAMLGHSSTDFGSSESKYGPCALCSALSTSCAKGNGSDSRPVLRGAALRCTAVFTPSGAAGEGPLRRLICVLWDRLSISSSWSQPWGKELLPTSSPPKYHLDLYGCQDTVTSQIGLYQAGSSSLCCPGDTRAFLGSGGRVGLQVCEDAQGRCWQ